MEGWLDAGQRQAGAQILRAFIETDKYFLSNPVLPQLDDYYEPFTYNYARLQNAPLSEATPTARPLSQITGEPIEKIQWGPNWEDMMGGEWSDRSVDTNMDGVGRDIYGQFEKTFHMY